MSFDPDLDRSNARFADGARAAVRADTRRIVIVGARGWIGRTTIALLHEALGAAHCAERVVCFGSQAGEVEVDGFVLPQRPLSELGTLKPGPTLLLHLAFLTKDKFAGMDANDYANDNRALSRTVFDALDAIGVDRLFVASSGAAAFADDPAATADLRAYGALKREDETRFAAWANEHQGRCAAIGRLFSVSGPHINKHDTYALASFILDALARRPIEVRSPMQVVRSYVAVRELVSVVFAALLAPDGDAVLRFDTGGEALELGEVAACVAETLGGTTVRRPITFSTANLYSGDGAGWIALLDRYGIAPLSLDDQIAETAAYLTRVKQTDAAV